MPDIIDVLMWLFFGYLGYHYLLPVIYCVAYRQYEQIKARISDEFRQKIARGGVNEFMERQPAVKSYFFGKGYRQLFGTIADAWSGNEQSACRVREKIKLLLKYHSSGSVMRWIDRIIVLFKLLELFSIYFFGTIASAAFSLIHMLIVFSVMLGVYIMFALIWTADRGYILIKGIFGACPKCKGKYKMPVYVCDCGAEHTRLTPGIYGILRRKCLCGNKLPTTFFNGRRLLASKCPCCGSVLSSREAVPVCIPAIGGPSVGH